MRQVLPWAAEDRFPRAVSVELLGAVTDVQSHLAALAIEHDIQLEPLPGSPEAVAIAAECARIIAAAEAARAAVGGRAPASPRRIAPSPLVAFARAPNARLEKIFARLGVPPAADMAMYARTARCTAEEALAWFIHRDASGSESESEPEPEMDAPRVRPSTPPLPLLPGEHPRADHREDCVFCIDPATAKVPR